MLYLTNLTDTGDDLKYDEEQLKRANEWRAEAELDYDYRMTSSSKNILSPARYLSEYKL